MPSTTPPIPDEQQPMQPKRRPGQDRPDDGSDDSPSSGTDGSRNPGRKSDRPERARTGAARAEGKM
jgi:hypothetical protein